MLLSVQDLSLVLLILKWSKYVYSKIFEVEAPKRVTNIQLQTKFQNTFAQYSINHT